MDCSATFDYFIVVSFFKIVTLDEFKENEKIVALKINWNNFIVLIHLIVFFFCFFNYFHFLFDFLYSFLIFYFTFLIYWFWFHRFLSIFYIFLYAFFICIKWKFFASLFQLNRKSFCHFFENIILTVFVIYCSGKLEMVLFNPFLYSILPFFFFILWKDFF